MTNPFNPEQGLIIVPTVIHGPSGSGVLQLALDTGATGTLINLGPLVSLGYDPSLVTGRVQVTTGSGVEFLPLLSMTKISALGRSRRHFPVLGHTLPTSATIDGLLGLDFLRGSRLEINFQTGLVRLTV